MSHTNFKGSGASFAAARAASLPGSAAPSPYDEFLASEPPAPAERISAAGHELAYYEPLKLNPRHKTILALKASGLTNTEIAEIVKVSQSHVSIIVNHPDAQSTLAELTTNHVADIVSDVGQMFKAAAREAFLKNLTLMRSAKSEIVQQRSAFDILDRAGFKPRELPPAAPKIDFGDKGAVEIATALREVHSDYDEKPQLTNSDGAFKKRNEAADPDYEIVP